MRLYQVAPAVGDVKLRNFGAVHTAEEMAPPLSSLGRPVHWGDEEAGAARGRMTLVGVYANNMKSFSAAVDRSRMPVAVWEWMRGALQDMQRKFWGLRVEVGKLDKLRAAVGGRDVDAVLALSSDFLAEMQAGRAWLLAFEDAQDALRFCLSFCVELAYSPSAVHAWRGGSGKTTPDGAPLWSGPPVGFTMHAVEPDAVGLPGARGRGDGILSCCSLGGSKVERMEVNVRPGLLEMLALTRLVPAGCRVVLSGAAWARLNEGVGGQPAHFGKSVLEHLGTVKMPWLGRTTEVYQMLPVQLAARAIHFTSLREVAPGRLSLVGPGARDAPRLDPGLTFAFTRWFEPSKRDLRVLAPPHAGGGGDSGSGEDGGEMHGLRAKAGLAVEMGHVALECHEAMVGNCMKLGGYVVEEIGVCELLLAFPSVEVAVEFACIAQCGVQAAVLRNAALEMAGLGNLNPLMSSEGCESLKQTFDISSPLEDAPLPPLPVCKEDFTGFLAVGVASVWMVPRGRNGTGGGAGALSTKNTAPLLNLKLPSKGERLAVFSNIHPITGRCTYSSPAMNKAARAKALAKGGQVLFADQPVEGDARGAGGSLGASGDGLPTPLAAQLSVRVPGGGGAVRAKLRPAGLARLRGFAEPVSLSELVLVPADP